MSSSPYTSAAFWKATAERSVKTFAQTVGALLTGDNLLGIEDLDWKGMLSLGAVAAFYSVVTSVASAPIGTAGPSLVRAETLSPPAAQIDADDPRV